MKSGNLYGGSVLAAAGCLALLLAGTTLWAQETKEKVMVDDVDRTFMVRLPKGYDPQQHYPVMILLHGMNQDPEDMERLTRFNELADKDGIIAIYPSALHGRWNVGVHPQERKPMTMGSGGGRGRRGGGGYPGGEEEVIPVEVADTQEGVAGIRAVGDNSPKAESPVKRKGRLPQMTSPSLIRC